jgi:beta-lactamase class A
MTRILNYKLKVKYIPIVVFVSVLGTYIVATYFFEPTQSSENNVTAHKEFQVKRLNGYKFIKPLLLVDSENEASELSSIKQSLEQVIQEFKNKGVLTSASVYIREYENNGWCALNPNEQYKPGSLLKIPELITFLKMNELHPGLLDKKYLFNQKLETDKKPIYTTKSIQLGQSYSVRELLKYMIVHSDNNATYILNSIIDVALFKKVFTDLGLTAPDWNASDYPVNVKDISIFMRALYNGSYLTADDSEYATLLLTQSDFKLGIAASLPNSIQFSHKFGEAGDALEKQLHETALVYLNNRTYLITVMTKGTSFNSLPEVIKQISAMVYREMAADSQVL